MKIINRLADIVIYAWFAALAVTLVVDAYLVFVIGIFHV